MQPTRQTCSKCHNVFEGSDCIDVPPLCANCEWERKNPESGLLFIFGLLLKTLKSKEKDIDAEVQT